MINVTTSENTVNISIDCLESYKDLKLFLEKYNEFEKLDWENTDEEKIKTDFRTVCSLYNQLTINEEKYRVDSFPYSQFEIKFLAVLLDVMGIKLQIKIDEFNKKFGANNTKILKIVRVRYQNLETKFPLIGDEL